MSFDENPRDNEPIDREDYEKWESENKNQAAVALGKITSKKKAAASRKNGKLGGRPKKSNIELQREAVAKRVKTRAQS